MSATESTAGLDSAAFLKTLTHRPGVYRFFDAAGEILYVGKARDLRRRVANYFSGRATDAKTMALRGQIAACEVTVTRTETEALLLENELIKRHRPRFNIVLRDDKSYPYIRLSDTQGYPRLSFYRGARSAGAELFGPYPSAGAVRETLGQLQKIFRIRQCRDSFFANRTRPCLQYQIKRCTAPCVGLISREDYARDVADARAFLSGQSGKVGESLAARMEEAAEKLDFERAAELRDQLARIKRIEERQLVATRRSGDIDVIALEIESGVACVGVLFIRGGRLLGSRAYFPAGAGEADGGEILEAFMSQHYLNQPPPREIVVSAPVAEADLLAAGLSEQAAHRVEIKSRVRGDRAGWLEMAATNAKQALATRLSSNQTLRLQLEDLADALDLPETPSRLECFDVSHLGGESTVAACVVYDDQGPRKSDYRRFNVEGVVPGDDYAAMAQAVRRRYTRVKQGEVPLPDVLFIDGGRGQVELVADALAEMQIDGVAIVGVAKGADRKPGREKLVLAGRKSPLILPPSSGALHLIQQIRDEAHRFAITGHRQRRARQRQSSPLEGIPGLGPKRRRELLRAFGGLRGVSRAGVDDLSRVTGISRTLAEKIYAHFHSEG